MERPPRKDPVPLILLQPDSANANQNVALGDSVSNLLFPSFEMADLKPKQPTKRKSGDDMSKRNKAARLTPQIRELDCQKDVVASLSQAIPVMELDPESQHNEPSTLNFKKADCKMRVDIQKAISNTDSETQNDTLKGGDTISVDSQDVGVDTSIIAELRQLKVRPNTRFVMGDENMKQLALKEVINAVPLWKDCLSTVNNQELSEYFNGDSFKSFFVLDESIRTLRIKGMPDRMRTELEKLRKMCQDASNKHLSEGRYDHDGTNKQITIIEGLAYDYKMERGAAGLEAGATATPKIPSNVYSGRSLTILHNLWGAGLYSGTEDKDVQNAIKNVHEKMPTKYHELLCHEAWKFQANEMRLLSPEWMDFCRFAFGEKTTEGLTTNWQQMFVAISDSLKFQLQETNYSLCPCNISHPHSATAFQKTLQFIQDAENNTKERIKQVVSTCAALAFFDSIIEEGSETSKHTDENSYRGIRTAMECFKGYEELSDETKYDLSNVMEYLDAAEAKRLDGNKPSEREKKLPS